MVLGVGAFGMQMLVQFFSRVMEVPLVHNTGERYGSEAANAGGSGKRGQNGSEKGASGVVARWPRAAQSDLV